MKKILRGVVVGLMSLIGLMPLARGDGTPMREASVAEMNAGVAGIPAVVTPRRLGTLLANGTNTTQLLATNFVAGQTYSNGYGAPIYVKANAVCTAAPTNYALALLVTFTNGQALAAYTTNASPGLRTTITVNVTNDVDVTVAGVVPAGWNYYFTNLVTGDGSVTYLYAPLYGNGQLWVPGGGTSGVVTSNGLAAVGMLGNATTGNAATATVATNLNGSNPFDFPFVGNMHNNQLHYGVTIPANGTQTLLSVGAGTNGVVRQIQITTTVQMTTSNTLLMVYTAGSSTPDVAIPLCCFWGDNDPDPAYGTFINGMLAYYDRQVTDFNTGTSIPVLRSLNSLSTDFADIQNYDSSTASAPYINALIKFPIPFTNGITLLLTNVTGSGSTLIGGTVLWQDQLASTWNSNLRFHVYRTNAVPVGATTNTGTLTVSGTNAYLTGGTFPVDCVGKYIAFPAGAVDDALIDTRVSDTQLALSVADFRTPETQLTNMASFYICDAFNFINRPAGKVGYIAGITGGWNIPLFNTAESRISCFEGNVRMKLNQEAFPSLKWAANEDFFGGEFFWLFGQGRTSGAGIIEIGSSYFNNSVGQAGGTPITAYRWFKQVPIGYTNGITGINPATQDSNWPTTYNWCVFYYEQ